MSDQPYQYNPNPARGCGRKVPGGCYAEGGDFSVFGTLSVWTWFLGEHYDGGTNCLPVIPARQMVWGNLPYSLLAGEFVSADVSRLPMFDHMADDMVKAGLPRLALFDHVGSQSYTPWAFQQETRWYGPSRRIPPMLARELVHKTPVPVVFTAKLPVFGSKKERDLVAGAVSELVGRNLDTGPTWAMPGFGMTADRMNSGSDHFMVELIFMMDKWSKRGYGAGELGLRKVMGRVKMVEAVFGASWFTRISYVESEMDTAQDLEDIRQAGLKVITADQL